MFSCSVGAAGYLKWFNCLACPKNLVEEHYNIISGIVKLVVRRNPKASTPEMQIFLEALEGYVDTRIAYDKVKDTEREASAGVVCRQAKFQLKTRLLRVLDDL